MVYGITHLRDALASVALTSCESAKTKGTLGSLLGLHAQNLA